MNGSKPIAKSARAKLPPVPGRRQSHKQQPHKSIQKEVIVTILEKNVLGESGHQEVKGGRS